jgi:hypothetical protein
MMNEYMFHGQFMGEGRSFMYEEACEKKGSSI